jgi:ADP-heptose:LPS heptosyltransferase
MNLQKKRRIIIYRVGAIGDVVHTLPFVKLLRKNNPDAQIEYIVGSRQLLDLLEQCAAYIDKVWLVTKKTLNTEMSNIAAAGKTDEFIFLHSGWLKACWLNLRFIKASKLSIYKRDDSISAVANYVTSYYPKLKQDLLVDPFKLLEWKTLTPISRNDVPVDQTCYESSRTRLASPEPPELTSTSMRMARDERNAVIGLSGQVCKPYICIVPGVGNLRPHRAYPLEKWAELIVKHLTINSDNNIILLGGPDEKELSISLDNILSTKLSSEQKLRVTNLIGKTSLAELTSILSQSQHLYSADTGILHIGAAVGVPITAIFSITSKQRFGPFSPNAEIVRAPDCLCEASSTNRPKHCSHLVEGYAACTQSLEL